MADVVGIHLLSAQQLAQELLALAFLLGGGADGVAQLLVEVFQGRLGIVDDLADLGHRQRRVEGGVGGGVLLRIDGEDQGLAFFQQPHIGGDAVLQFLALGAPLRRGLRREVLDIAQDFQQEGLEAEEQVLEVVLAGGHLAQGQGDLADDQAAEALLPVLQAQLDRRLEVGAVRGQRLEQQRQQVFVLVALEAVHQFQDAGAELALDGDDARHVVRDLLLRRAVVELAAVHRQAVEVDEAAAHRGIL